MHVSPSRFDLSQSTERRLEDFRELVWFNSEVCNECFTRIRSIGPERPVTPESSQTTHQINEWYERTEDATQEHTGFEAPSERYGATFCRECGAEAGTRWSDTRPVEQLREQLVRLLRYTHEHTPLTVSPKRADAELRKLKTGPESRDRQGRDLQCIAVAWCRAAEGHTESASVPQARAD
jgi:hypothetical protein